MANAANHPGGVRRDVAVRAYAISVVPKTGRRYAEASTIIGAVVFTSLLLLWIYFGGSDNEKEADHQ